MDMAPAVTAALGRAGRLEVNEEIVLFESMADD
jgi:hypothetical protein